MLINIAGMLVIILLVILWQSTSSLLYRRPILIFALGVFVGMLSVFGEATVASLGAVVPRWASEEAAGVAPLLISVLTSATAGSLIAAAVILQAQKKHESELRQADESLDRLSADIENIEDELKDIMSEDERADHYKEFLQKKRVKIRLEVRVLQGLLRKYR